MNRVCRWSSLCPVMRSLKFLTRLRSLKSSEKGQYCGILKASISARSKIVCPFMDKWPIPGFHCRPVEGLKNGMWNSITLFSFGGYRAKLNGESLTYVWWIGGETINCWPLYFKSDRRHAKLNNPFTWGGGNWAHLDISNEFFRIYKKCTRISCRDTK